MEQIRQEQRRRPQQRRRTEKKEAMKSRRRFVFGLWQLILFLVLLLLFWDIRKQLREVTSALKDAGMIQETEKSPSAERKPLENAFTDYVSLCGLPEVEKPVIRNSAEVLEELRRLSGNNEIIAEIYQNKENYPESLMEALANNPEMARFVRDYPEADKRAVAGLTESEKKQKYPLLLQWDPRWGYASYGDSSSIAVSGCGPTSLSMALYYLTRDETLTPDKIAEYSMENGYYVSGTGTAWALMKDVPGQYGVKVSQPGIDEWKMQKELDEGHIIICAMKKGDFTAAGHFIVIYGYDESGFKINDPNCVARSRKSWSFQKLGSQIKSLWSFA